MRAASCIATPVRQRRVSIMNRRNFVVGAAAAAVMPFARVPSGKAQKLPQDGVEWFTDVEVTAQDGRTFKFYDDLLKGKSSASTSSLLDAARSARW
jgi:hypothetical protein